MQDFVAAYAPLLLDAAVVLIFAGCVVFAYVRGFMKSSYTILSLILTVVLMYALQTPFEEYISQSALGQNIAAGISRQVVVEEPQTPAESPEVKGLPAFLQVKIQGQIDAAENAAAEIAADASALAAEAIISVISVVLLFLLVRLGVFLLLRLTDKLFRLPVLKFVNKTAGVLIGVVNALFLVYLLAGAAMLLVPADQIGLLDKAMHQTYFAGIFYNNNVLLELFM